MSDRSEDTLLEAARKFNAAVEATAVVGALRVDMRNMKADIAEIRGDVRHIRTTIDHWGGAITLISAGLSIAVSLVVAALRLHP